KSDTRDLGREYEPADIDCYNWLFPLIDKPALSRIEHPSVPARYFAAYHRAYERARLHGGGEAVVVDMGEVYVPEIVPEVAERLVSLEGLRWSLATGSYKGELYLSLRLNDRRVNAGKLVREVCAPLGGSAGGHGAMAGARIPLRGRSPELLANDIFATFLRAFHLRPGPGTVRAGAGLRAAGRDLRLWRDRVGRARHPRKPSRQSGHDRRRASRGVGSVRLGIGVHPRPRVRVGRARPGCPEAGAPGGFALLGDGCKQRDRRHLSSSRDRRDVPRLRHSPARRRGAGGGEDAARFPLGPADAVRAQDLGSEGRGDSGHAAQGLRSPERRTSGEGAARRDGERGGHRRNGQGAGA